MTGADIGRQLGRGANWLSRFERGLPGSDLRWDEARELIELLGESPEVVRTRLIRGVRLDRS